jgi:hypothetical protein
MFSVALVSVLILALFYPRYQHDMLRFVSYVTASNRNLAFFMLAIFIVPILLVLL